MDFHSKYLCILIVFYVELCLGARPLVGYSGIHATCGSIHTVNKGERYTFNEIITESPSPNFLSGKSREQPQSIQPVPSYTSQPQVQPQQPPPQLGVNANSLNGPQQGPQYIQRPVFIPGPNPPTTPPVDLINSRQLYQDVPAVDRKHSVSDDRRDYKNFAPAQQPLPKNEQVTTQTGASVVTNNELRRFPEYPGLPPKFQKPAKRASTKPDMMRELRELSDRKGYPVIPAYRRSIPVAKTGGPRDKFPSYIQHLIGKKSLRQKQTPDNRNAPQTSAFPRQHDNNGAPANSGNNAVSPNDILGQLTPQKLDELRNLLNSASGPYGAPHGGVDKRDIAKTFNDQQQKYGRSKRDLHNRRLRRFNPKRENPTATNLTQNVQPVQAMPQLKCGLSFKKGRDCKRLVIRMDYWFDNVKDCDLEYVQFTGTAKVDKLCAGRHHYRPYVIQGEKVYVEHAKRGTRPGSMQFKGSVRCE